MQIDLVRELSDSLLSERLEIFTPLMYQLLASHPVGMGTGFSGRLPSGGGVYRIFETGSPLDSTVYVGKTGNFFERLYRNHLQGNPQASTLKRKMIERGEFRSSQEVKAYFKERCSVQLISIEDEPLRHWFEHFAIATLQPRYN